MKPKQRFAGLALIAALFAPDTGAAHTQETGGLQIVHPWVAPAKAGATAWAHPTLTNQSDEPITITGVETPVAGEVVMLREGTPVGEVTLEPGETLTPDTFTVALRQLAVALPKGKGVPVTVKVAGQDPVAIHLAVGQGTMNPETLVQVPQTQ